MTRLTRFILPVTALALLLMGRCAEAAVLRTFTTSGATFSTTAITDFSTSGDMMDGMQVTAFFGDGNSETKTWVATGAGAGGVTGSKGGGWSLTEADDTFFNPWHLTNNTGVKMTAFALSGSPLTTFDTFHGFNTANSSLGINLFETGPTIPGLTIDVLYHGALRLGANAPRGDEFILLDATFTNPAGLASGNTLHFMQDTDNATTEIVAAPPAVAGVPEPSTILLAALGLFGTVFVALRKKYRRA